MPDASTLSTVGTALPNVGLALLLAVLLALAACDGGGREPEVAPAPCPANADRQAGAPGQGMDFDAFVAEYGAPPQLDHDTSLGAVLTFHGFRFVQLKLHGMVDAAVALNARLRCQAGATDSDEQGQRTRALELLGRGPDALLVTSLTLTNLDDLFTLADERDVPVVCVDEAGAAARGVYVGTDHYRCGRQAASLFQELAPAGGKVAVLRTRAVTWSSQQRTQGFLDALPDSFELVAQPECFGDMQTALFAASSILRRHPDLLGFFCVSDTLALGAVRAAHRADAGRALVVGAGGSETSRALVRQGRMAALIDCRPHEIGRAAVQVAAHLLHDNPPPRAVYVRPLVRTPEHPQGVAQLGQPTPPAGPATADSAGQAGSRREP